MIELVAISGSLPAIVGVGLAMLCVGLAAWAFASRRESPEDQISRRLSTWTPTDSASPAGSLDLLGGQGRGSLASRMSVLSKPLDIHTHYDRHKLALRLAQAGFRSPTSVTFFLGAKMLLLIVAATGGFAYAVSNAHSTMNIFSITSIMGVAGFVLPNLWLALTASKRTEGITNALPDSLDMLVIAVEAGLGLDAAIQRVGEEMSRTYPDLALEWQLAARETQMGIPRSEAMAKMAERTNVPEMRAMVAIVTQAERFGTSIAHTLRVHADTVRIKRRQRAEERAARTAVKLVIPLLFFLFPVIFIVMLGPPVVGILESGFLD